MNELSAQFDGNPEPSPISVNSSSDPRSPFQHRDFATRCDQILSRLQSGNTRTNDQHPSPRLDRPLCTQRRHRKRPGNDSTKCQASRCSAESSHDSFFHKGLSRGMATVLRHSPLLLMQAAHAIRSNSRPLETGPKQLPDSRWRSPPPWSGRNRESPFWADSSGPSGPAYKLGKLLRARSLATTVRNCVRDREQEARPVMLHRQV